MAIVIEILKDISKLCRTCMNIIDDDDDNNVIVEGGDLYKMLKYVTSLNVRFSPQFTTECTLFVCDLSIAHVKFDCNVHFGGVM